MCDYSLEAYQSRPAAVGEKLTLGRFASGSMGFASGTVCDTAVCIPAESRLLLEGIGEGTQKELGVGGVEEAVLIRLKRGLYRDAVLFSNGSQVTLQHLDRGPGLQHHVLGRVHHTHATRAELVRDAVAADDAADHARQRPRTSVVPRWASVPASCRFVTAPHRAGRATSASAAAW